MVHTSSARCKVGRPDAHTAPVCQRLIPRAIRNFLESEHLAAGADVTLVVISLRQERARRRLWKIIDWR